MDCKELRAKYRRRLVKVNMTGSKMSWPPDRPITKTFKKTRIWGPDHAPDRNLVDWGRHIDDHDLLVKQVECNEWDR